MQDDKKLELLLERFYNRFNQYNTKVLQKMGEAIKKFDGISPSIAHQIAQELKYGFDIIELKEELSKISEKSIKDLEEAFDIIAKENNDFAKLYAKVNNIDFIEYKDNEQLQQLVSAIKKETEELFLNISKTNAIGFVLKDKEGNKLSFKPLKDAYIDLVDEAVLNVTTGVDDYQSAMRGVTNQLAQSGVKIHEEKIEYPSGYNIRIDSAVKQNILTGIRKLNINIQQQVGELYGANGVEISAHSGCAEDHLHVQGKQYSKKEFEKVNGSLDRPIGEYNCRHFIFNIVLGVSQPNYTQKQLKQFEKESISTIKYEGKTYTMYEATQVQRKMETAIRQAKDNQIINVAKGDKDEVAKYQQKITELTNKYKEFSDYAGLDVYTERLRVSGYKRVNIKNMK